MFWKFIGLIVRIIYFRRFQKAKKIGEAAKLLGENKPSDALSHLEKHSNSIHQTLLPLYAMTRAKILETLERFEEAEQSYKSVVLMNPKDSKADLALAILTGKQFRFEECRTWLNRAIEKENNDIKKQALEIKTLLDQIESGEKQKEYESRAKKMAEKELLDGNCLGIPLNVDLLKQWAQNTPNAIEHIDDIALLLAYCQVQTGGTWKISLSIEDSYIEKSDGTSFHPFEKVLPYFEGHQPS